MPPFAQVHCHHDLRLQACRQYATGDFRRTALSQELEILAFSIDTGRCPGRQLLLPQVRRDYDCDFLPKFRLVIGAVAGAFLRVTRESVPHNLVGYPTVDEKLDADTVVFEHRFVPAQYKLLDQLSVIRPGALVASPGGAGDCPQRVLPRVVLQQSRGENFISRFNDFHMYHLPRAR